LKELTKKRIEKEKEEAQERIQKEDALRKKVEDIKRAREEAKREEEEAAEMGGMPGGMPGPGRSKDVDTTKLYEVLGVEKDADAKTLKKAYRKLCLKHHPDKGGDEHFFKEVNAGAFRFISFSSWLLLVCYF